MVAAVDFVGLVLPTLYSALEQLAQNKMNTKSRFIDSDT